MPDDPRSVFEKYRAEFEPPAPAPPSRTPVEQVLGEIDAAVKAKSAKDLAFVRKTGAAERARIDEFLKNPKWRDAERRRR